MGLVYPLLSSWDFVSAFVSSYGEQSRLTFGRFFARSMMATRVPMTGPSTDMSAKIAAAWLTVRVAIMCRERVVVSGGMSGIASMGGAQDAGESVDVSSCAAIA